MLRKQNTQASAGIPTTTGEKSLCCSMLQLGLQQHSSCPLQSSSGTVSAKSNGVPQSLCQILWQKQSHLLKNCQRTRSGATGETESHLYDQPLVSSVFQICGWVHSYKLISSCSVCQSEVFKVHAAHHLVWQRHLECAESQKRQGRSASSI